MDASTVEDETGLLQLECAFYRRLLAAHGAPSPSALPAAAADGCNPLPLAVKLELCTTEVNSLHAELEDIKLAGELELSCTQAAIADCRQRQLAEVAHDLAALLKALGVSSRSKGASSPSKQTSAAGSPVAGHAYPSQGAACSAGGTGKRDQDPGESAGPARILPSSPGGLPSAKELDKAELSRPQLERHLSAILERHEAAAARLESRNALLQVRDRRDCC